MLSPVLGGFCRYRAELQRLRRRGRPPARRAPRARRWRCGASSAAIRSAPAASTRSPRNSIMEERRLLLAVALSLLVLTGYQILFAARSRAPAAVARRAGGRRPEPDLRRRPRRRRPGDGRRGRRRRPDRRAGGGRARTSASGASRSRARTSQVAFANKGARLVSWRLNHYRDARGPARGDGAGGRRSGIASARPRDRATRSWTRGCARRSSARPPSTWPSRRARRPSCASSSRTGDLEAREGPALPRPRATSSRCGRTVRRARPSRAGQRSRWGPGVGQPHARPRWRCRATSRPRRVYLGPGGVERLPAEEIGDRRARARARAGSGVESHYFARPVVPPPPGMPAELARGVACPPAEDGKPRLGVAAAIGARPRRGAGTLYVGPKDHHRPLAGRTTTSAGWSPSATGSAPSWCP